MASKALYYYLKPDVNRWWKVTEIEMTAKPVGAVEYANCIEAKG